METPTDQFFEDKGVVCLKEEVPKIILTISAIALDFDFVTSDSSKSRADEIKVLLVKNKKPPRKSKEGKPGGCGLPTGQFESKEVALHAVKRETEEETGCLVKKVIGKLFVIHKMLKIDGNPVPNDIHVFLIEASEPIRRVTETNEIDPSFEPWISLRQVFEMPFAQDKNMGNKNPNGIYFSHLQRLYRAIESMVFSPEDLLEGEAATEWLRPNRKSLLDAMADLERAGLLEKFLTEEPRDPMQPSRPI